MEYRSRHATAGLAPGTDPAALRVITAVVAAGLIMTVVAVVALSGAAPAAMVASARRVSTPPASQRAGLGMLTRAARACHSVTYQGVEVLAWWGPSGASTSIVDVWHQRGGRTLTQAAPAATVTSPASAADRVPVHDGGAAPSLDGNGVLGLSSRMVALLGANYTVSVTGEDQVVGRPTSVVTVRRSDGSLAARFWLDSATGLPLRREMFDAGDRLVSDVMFAQVTIARGELTGVPSPGAQRWPDTLDRAQLADMRARGWPLPGPLPAGLALLSARRTDTPSGPVVDLDYSDGLSVVSIFVQRGHLPADMAGWSLVALQGHKVYADDPDDLSLTWSAHGFVYTVIAAAPLQTVGQVVSALPHEGGPGILGRIRRGLRRMFSWASP